MDSEHQVNEVLYFVKVAPVSERKFIFAFFMRSFSRFLPAFLLLLLSACRLESPQKQADTAPPAQAARPVNARPAAQVPAYVSEVLDIIKKTGRAPEGYVGGRPFENRERRLPVMDQLRYREWDVHPKVPGQNRGPERLITGSDESAWFTSDHYRTFLKIE